MAARQNNSKKETAISTVKRNRPKISLSLGVKAFPARGAMKKTMASIKGK